MSCAYTHFPVSSPKHSSDSREHRDEEEIYYSSVEESDSEEEEERQDHRNGGEGEEGDSRDEHVSGYRLNDRVTSTLYMTPIKDEIVIFVSTPSI